VDHHSFSSAASLALIYLTSALPSFPLFAYYSSRFAASCWVLIVYKSLAMKRSTITSFQRLSLGRTPLKIMTSLANIQNTKDIDLGTLLLQGITRSTNYKGASVLQRAMQGMLTYEASITAWLSLLGSATIKSLGYWNFLVT
jgi:hypothetical protein